MKAKILTTTPIKQEWLDEVKEYMPDIEFEIIDTKEKLQVRYHPVTKTNYGVFAHLRQMVNAPTGYRYRVYNMTSEERKALKMTDHYAVYDSLDKDGVLDFYMGLPTKILARTKLNGFKYNWSKTFIHESLHGKEQEIGREYMAVTNPDRVHEWEKEGRLKELAAEHFRLEKLSLTIFLLGKVKSLLIQLKIMKEKQLDAEKKNMTYYHPVPNEYRILISQAYGQKNSLYPITGRHIGVDYAIPVGTPLVAPYDSKVVAIGYSATLGNYCHILYLQDGEQWMERWCHLKKMPRIGSYFGGGIVAYSGATGNVTGAHLHREKWRNEVRIDLITKENWGLLTVDPELN